ncbi:MAG: hypothetical protein D6780_02205 [Candidatus Dadabacteria bacterium]|nr:MAG: hypothetical protein D6780_02205 [Candidatus Dadabacteria bacterium]
MSNLIVNSRQNNTLAIALNSRDEKRHSSLDGNKPRGDVKQRLREGVIDLTECTFTSGKIWRTNFQSNRDLSLDRSNNKKNRLDKKVSKETKKEPSEKAAINKKRIKWVKRWLNIGRTVSALASYLYSGAMFAIAGSYLFTTHSPYYVGLWGANLSISLMSVGILYLVLSKRDKTSTKYAPSPRVQKIADELCKKAGKPPQDILSLTDFYNFAMVDMPGKKNVMLVDENLAEKLSDAELKGILAHELSHADKGYTFLSLSQNIMNMSGALGMFLATSHFLTYSPLTTHLAGFSTFLAAWGSASILHYLGNKINNVTSRANELLTDIRAIELTEDPNSYISALKNLFREIQPIIAEQNPIKKFFTEFLGTTHPRQEARIRLLKKWFSS